MLAVLLALFVAADVPPVRFAGGDFVATGFTERQLARLAARKSDDAEFAKFLAVGVHRPGEPLRQMLGTWRVVGKELRFTPRFAVTPGVAYRAELPAAGAKVTIDVPKPAVVATTTVKSAYPTADVVPENLLKFYLHFSAPMTPGDCLKHVSILDDKGRSVDTPFLDQELWDATNTRLTLLIDPGRIKRGLKPREDLGAVLEAGRKYTLVVAADFADAEGNPMKQAFRKPFTATAGLEKQPDVKAWKLTTPRTGTREPLQVTFATAMDHALALRMIVVVDAAGKVVEGTPTLANKETEWSFVPKSAWAEGWSLRVDTRLEDLAGNSPGRPFEVDVLRPVERKIEAAFETRPVRLAK